MRLNPDAPVMRFFARLFDLALLQILFLLTSIPLITIGAGLTAVFSVCRKLYQDSVTSLTRTYFEDFKSGFRQSTVAWLVFLVCGGLLALDILYYKGQSEEFLTLPLLVAYVLLALLLAEFIYIFPLMAWFENKLSAHLKNAPMLALYHILATVLVGVLYWIVWKIFLSFLPLTILLGFSGSAYIATVILSRVFLKHGAHPYSPEDFDD